ncbi:glycosyltransferase [Winogradskyella sp. PG-2]|nr:glycosyltransferase [Winogradskyella sp. PG-2]
MTVYNREKYIAEAIESVMASTYKNWELIIVDDRSKDQSVTIAKAYQEQDKRIKVYINEENLGDYPNRNKAASYAKGKYLKYVDADDMIYPYGLQQLVFYMEQFPEAGYGLCSLSQDKHQKFPFQLNPTEAYQRQYFKEKLFHKAPLSAIINKSIFEKAGGFTGKRMLGDFEMWHILSQEFSVVLMPQGIVWYREHDEQEMADHRSDPMQPYKYVLLAENLINSPKCPLNEGEKAKALKKIDYTKSRSILSATKHYSLSKALELKRQSKLSYIQIFLNLFSK